MWFILKENLSHSHINRRIRSSQLQSIQFSQNIDGYYPIMVQIFICKVKGELLEYTSETKNVRWISLEELNKLLESNEKVFYPMHVYTLKKYLRKKGFMV